jgi:hypothetical protein
MNLFKRFRKLWEPKPYFMGRLHWPDQLLDDLLDDEDDYDVPQQMENSTMEESQKTQLREEITGTSTSLQEWSDEELQEASLRSVIRSETTCLRISRPPS